MLRQGHGGRLAKSALRRRDPLGRELDRGHDHVAGVQAGEGGRRPLDLGRHGRDRARQVAAGGEGQEEERSGGERLHGVRTCVRRGPLRTTAVRASPAVGVPRARRGTGFGVPVRAAQGETRKPGTPEQARAQGVKTGSSGVRATPSTSLSSCPQVRLVGSSPGTIRASASSSSPDRNGNSNSSNRARGQRVTSASAPPRRQRSQLLPFAASSRSRMTSSSEPGCGSRRRMEKGGPGWGGPHRASGHEDRERGQRSHRGSGSRGGRRPAGAARGAGVPHQLEAHPHVRARRAREDRGAQVIGRAGHHVEGAGPGGLERPEPGPRAAGDPRSDDPGTGDRGTGPRRGARRLNEAVPPRQPVPGHRDREGDLEQAGVHHSLLLRGQRERPRHVDPDRAGGVARRERRRRGALPEAEEEGRTVERGQGDACDDDQRGLDPELPRPQGVRTEGAHELRRLTVEGRRSRQRDGREAAPIGRQSGERSVAEVEPRGARRAHLAQRLGRERRRRVEQHLQRTRGRVHDGEQVVAVRDHGDDGRRPAKRELRAAVPIGCNGPPTAMGGAPVVGAIVDVDEGPCDRSSGDRVEHVDGQRGRASCSGSRREDTALLERDPQLDVAPVERAVEELVVEGPGLLRIDRADGRGLGHEEPGTTGHDHRGGVLEGQGPSSVRVERVGHHRPAERIQRLDPHVGDGLGGAAHRTRSRWSLMKTSVVPPFGPSSVMAGGTVSKSTGARAGTKARKLRAWERRPARAFQATSVRSPSPR